MTAPEEAVMGFAAEETVLTLEAAALFLAALLTAALAAVPFSVALVSLLGSTVKTILVEPLALAVLAAGTAVTVLPLTETLMVAVMPA